MSAAEAQLRLDDVCRRINEGRCLARQLAAALRAHHLNESEFRLLWLLQARLALPQGRPIEQSALATTLGVSTAQVSALVEKLRRQQWILPVTASGDRRRQLWRLTPVGQEHLQAVSAAVGLVCRDWNLLDSNSARTHSQQEDAA